jgi:hypothetical protein
VYVEEVGQNVAGRLRRVEPGEHKIYAEWLYMCSCNYHCLSSLLFIIVVGVRVVVVRVVVRVEPINGHSVQEVGRV